MELLERSIVFFVGCALGFILGWICAHLRNIERKLEVVDDHIIEYEAKVDHMHDERGSWAIPRWLTFTNIAMILVVVLVAYAAFASQVALNRTEENVMSDKQELCKSGEDSRQVQRETVEQIFKLATGALVRDANAPPLTDFEFEQYNAYIDRVNLFRSSMYRQIQPSELCAPYVNDADVEPPTPAVPHITR